MKAEEKIFATSEEKGFAAASSPKELLAQADKLAVAGERFAGMVGDLAAAILAARMASHESDDPDDQFTFNEWDDAQSACDIVQKAAGTVAKHLEILTRKLRLAAPVN